MPQPQPLLLTFHPPANLPEEPIAIMVVTCQSQTSLRKPSVVYDKPIIKLLHNSYQLYRIVIVTII
jgi:hypothetical protein